jgi:hypothetical protein
MNKVGKQQNNVSSALAAGREYTGTNYPDNLGVLPAEGLRLIKAFVKIPDLALRNEIVNLVEDAANRFAP